MVIIKMQKVESVVLKSPCVSIFFHNKLKWLFSSAYSKNTLAVIAFFLHCAVYCHQQLSLWFMYPYYFE